MLRARPYSNTMKKETHRIGSGEQIRIRSDSVYKSFFSEKEMVQSFLCSFVPADFVQDLDFSTLQMLPTEHVTETWHLRVNDIVWKIEYK